MQRMVVWSMFGGAVALLCGFDINETPSPVESYEIARGARLYDSWYGEKGVDAPAKRHPAYPASGGYANKVASTWRCKECHGWDYLGRSGATGRVVTSPGSKERWPRQIKVRSNLKPSCETRRIAMIGFLMPRI